jgi:molybdopterin synthase sulfur carrier subunit
VWLAKRGETYAHVKPDAAISGAREIAFFPPMTGG